MADLSHIRLDPASTLPVYRQLAGSIERLIEARDLKPGEKLPPTRELASLLGLNRTTVSAAYAALETLGLIEGQVGRGSFVRAASTLTFPPDFPEDGASSLQSTQREDPNFNFSNSRPAASAFPLASFRRLTKEVVDSPEAIDILQLGAASGYPPLRRFLKDESEQLSLCSQADDLLVTNGCQQALDLIGRVYGGPGAGIAVEDPGYHGMLRAFSRTGAELFGVPVDGAGIDTQALERVLSRHHPKLIAVTPNFQNPTGATMTLDRRRRLLQLAEQYHAMVVEVDIYSPLRYTGEPLPELKQLAQGTAQAANTLLLRSYSKVSFPGLRVGWVVGARHHMARLIEAKEITDLHSDQLSQAVLLRFAQSGELRAHLNRTCQVGKERLHAILSACAHFLPAGSRWTKPEGGMNLWVELPSPLTADRLLRAVEPSGVSFLPGTHFSIRAAHANALRLSFGGLAPADIVRGVRILGEAAASALQAISSVADHEPLAALV